MRRIYKAFTSSFIASKAGVVTEPITHTLVSVSTFHTRLKVYVQFSLITAHGFSDIISMSWGPENFRGGHYFLGSDGGIN